MRAQDPRIEEIKKLLANQKAVRAKSDGDRWAAMSYVRHRMPEQSVADMCPVPSADDNRLYDDAGVLAYNDFVTGFMGSLMSPSQEWFSPVLVPKDYGKQPDPAYGIEYTSAEKNKIMDELAHSNFYADQSIANRDVTAGSYSCTLVQNNPKENRIFLSTLEPWRCYFDRDLQSNWNLFLYEYELDGYELLEKFPDIDKSSKLFKDASVGRTNIRFDMLYVITENNRLRDSKGALMRFNRNKRFSVLEICLSRNEILSESGSDFFPVVIHVWEESGSSQYGVGPVMKYLSEFRKLNRLGYEYGLSIAKINHHGWLVPDAMMDSFSADPEARIAYQSKELIPMPLEEQQDITQALNALDNQRQVIRKLMYNDLFSYLSNTDKVYTATQVNAVKSETVSRLAPVYGNIQIQKIDPLLKLVWKIMLDNDRAELDTKYLGIDADYKMSFNLDSSMALQLRNYTQSQSASLVLEALGQVMQLQITSALDNVDTDNLMRAIMISSGAPSSFFVNAEDRDRKRQMQQQMAMDQMQLQSELTNSEINRNNAGAANLNNIAGMNGGEQ